MQLGMLPGESEFLPVAAADAELMDAAVAQNVVAAADHAGVTELRAEVVVAQIGVGVEVDDVQIGVFLCSRPDRAEGDQMLAAEQDRHFIGLEDLLRPSLNVGQSRLRRAEAELQITSARAASAEPKQSSRSPLSKIAQSVRSLS